MPSLKEQQQELKQWQMYYLGELRTMLRHCKEKAETIINCTPTGVGRNMMTDINMQLMSLETKLGTAVRRLAAEGDEGAMKALLRQTAENILEQANHMWEELSLPVTDGIFSTLRAGIEEGEINPEDERAILQIVENIRKSK